MAITKTPITRTTPAAIQCPHSLCRGKYDGNYALKENHNYFVQCLHGLAYCQACWPTNLEYSETCNQCLYNRHDECHVTQRFEPVTTIACPDVCVHYGPDFSGNIKSPISKKHYVACWKGVTVACIACPKRSIFSEQDNSCIWGWNFNK